jgi:AcrR family transcriptional regulator
MTMAQIAQYAEVSTPTVFNYFNTRDQLLLALVVQGHRQTQEWVHGFQPSGSNLADAIGEFLGMYVQASLNDINRKTWRHVAATRILLPDSDFVKQYDVLIG